MCIYYTHRPFLYSTYSHTFICIIYLLILAYYNTAVRTIHISPCLSVATWKLFKPMLQELQELRSQSQFMCLPGRIQARIARPEGYDRYELCS